MSDSKVFRCGSIVGQGHGDSGVCGQPNYGTDNWQCRACAIEELRHVRAENEANRHEREIVCANYDQLKAENEALRKDARILQWIVDNAHEEMAAAMGNDWKSMITDYVEPTND